MMDIDKKSQISKKSNANDSSDDEEDLIPKVVENYYFTDENEETVSFSVLSFHYDGEEAIANSTPQVFLQGTFDGGLQKIYKPVVAWQLSLQEQRPVLSVRVKEGFWIEIQKPRKIYEETIRNVLVTCHFLNYARNHPDASEKALWDHLDKILSTFDEKPNESDLQEHLLLIEEVQARDEKLQKSEVLKSIKESKSKKRKAVYEDQESKPKKTKFVISDGESDDDMEDMDGDIDESEEEKDDLFDSVCAICDNGGELLCCEGPCLRSFHPNKEAGSDSNCKSLGMTKAQVEAIQNFYCANCKLKQHQCFICGKLGCSDKLKGAEVFSCVSATCGRFYHPQCVSRMLLPENEAEELEQKIAAGEQFLCPVHKCVVCKLTENKEVKELQFAICRRCPKSYHRKCLPRNIPFEDDDDDEDEIQRAWDDLIPNRILIYCRKHKIDPELGTPKRNHIVFPEDPSVEKVLKRKEFISNKSQMKRTSEYSDKGKEKATQKSSEKKETRTPASQDSATAKSAISKKMSKEKSSIRKKEEKSSAGRKEDRSYVIELKNFSTPKDMKPKESELGKSKSSVSSIVKKKTDRTQYFSDSEIQNPVLEIVKIATAGLSLSDISSKHQVPSTHCQVPGQRNLDKVITQGKVEGAVEAVKSALKKLEEGGSIDDAKAVCEPEMLGQLTRWKSKLRVYLAPFLHGNRYTSFGRHFTTEEKLKQVVERLHWYINDGDMLVDFCCGANDFSRLMKAKLEETGKKCFYKNFDIIQPQYDFNFEKRDFMKVRKNELKDGSKLIMGLNPPFGVKAALAYKFAVKALEFKPKLLVLIVPKETKRLDTHNGYDLVWEDQELLSGQSFYLPGSTDLEANELGQWNTIAPPLYLWSRPDFTRAHKAIAIEKGHIGGKPTITKNEQNGTAKVESLGDAELEPDQRIQKNSSFKEVSDLATKPPSTHVTDQKVNSKEPLEGKLEMHEELLQTDVGVSKNEESKKASVKTKKAGNKSSPDTEGTNAKSSKKNKDAEGNGSGLGNQKNQKGKIGGKKNNKAKNRKRGNNKGKQGDGTHQLKNVEGSSEKEDQKRGFPGIRSSAEVETFGPGHYNREPLGRGIHDYSRASYDSHDEYIPADVNRGFQRNLPGGLASDYRVGSSEYSHNRYFGPGEHDFEAPRGRYSVEPRVPDWQMDDIPQRNRYPIGGQYPDPYNQSRPSYIPGQYGYSPPPSGMSRYGQEHDSYGRQNLYPPHRSAHSSGWLDD